MVFFRVGFGEGVHDDEEAEEQSDEIGVGDQPAVLTGLANAAGAVVAGGRAAALDHAARSLLRRFRGSRSLPLRKPVSLISSMRGLMPSRMAITPSSIISRRRWLARMRWCIFPAKGRKKRLARATP